MEFSAETPKATVFESVAAFLSEQGFSTSTRDDTRPWGGFFVIDESRANLFIGHFFPHLDPAAFSGFTRLSPKILLVAPHKRLSWQYHFRRSEIWKVIGGRAGVVVSDTDEETPLRSLKRHDVISLKQGERHRLVG